MAGLRKAALFATLAVGTGNIVEHTVNSAANHGGKNQVADMRPIVGIVKQLQTMEQKSKVEGEEEAKIFSKFKCYCENTLTNTTKQMEKLTGDIASTGNRISSLVALGSELAQKKSSTEADLKANKIARDEAAAVRKKAHEAFLKEEEDLSASLNQLNQALDTLTAVGGEDGKASSSALVAVTQELQKGSENAKRLLRGTVAALGQIPTNQESQTGGVAGVLKSTRDTYVTNLQTLRQHEADELKAFESFDKTKSNEHGLFTAMLDQITAGIADTTEELGQKRDQLNEAKDNLEKTTSFNKETGELCKEKTKINEERAMLRAQEEAALSRAIAVLNSDEAFASFGKTKATGFMQLSSVTQGDKDAHPKALSLLREAAHATHSSRLASVAALIVAGNPLAKVVSEIDKMQSRIAKEADQDKKHFDTCVEERKTNKENMDEKKQSIITLTSSVDELHKAIDEMTVTISTATEELANNGAQQKTQTELRKAENLEYQKNIANIKEAEYTVSKGMKVLKDYYNSLSSGESALVQVAKKSHKDAPKTNDGAYVGQSSAGSTVLGLLNDVLEDAKSEEKSAHEAEQSAQKSFEDESKALTDEESSLKETLSVTKGDLSRAQLDIDNKKVDLSNTQKEKTSIEEYLASIKSDCDFIQSNFDHREKGRAEESKALAAATESIKGTPAFQSAEAKAALA
eukprot:TRINITY_DN2624_c1_g1_i1.p1 TRINITY_DN2624_c1_g1~~TRINITY_DN2624_c1_g1_i1.p1  ORF type:complete len:690 (-),score=232.83 TRINITY_DN2624_c1_g1_i1:118-2187(-)